MTVINRQLPLKITDSNSVVLSVHDDKFLKGEPVSLGLDVSRYGVRASLAIELSLNDLSVLLDTLDTLLNERISRTAARSAPVT